MGLLEIPRELRDLIFQEMIVKPTNTITILSDFSNFRNEISACPPSICKVNRQIRQETLPTFYSANVFSAQLDNEHDLLTARRWLTAIGEENVRHLRILSMCGWTRVPFGQMSFRCWVKVVFNLTQGTMHLESSDNMAVSLQDCPSTANNVEELKAAYYELVQVRAGKPFDAPSIRRVMEKFNLLCTGY